MPDPLLGEKFQPFGEMYKDPALYAKIALGADLWAKQSEILRALTKHKKIAVKACHASGKSFLVGRAAVWWISRYPDGRVITTAPSWNQVRNVVWYEIRQAIANSQVPLPDCNLTDWKLGEDNWGIGISTNTGTRFQGFHGEHILIIADEAPGVPPMIWEAIEGIRAGGDVSILALGNPTIASGPFYEAFPRDGHTPTWKTFTISAFDTPNLQGFGPEVVRNLPPGLPEDDPIFKYCPRGGLTSRRWVYEMFWSYGEDTAFWQSRVLGEFPDQPSDALLARSWVNEAKHRPGLPTEAETLRAGIDVAGPGDDETVLYLTRGPNIVGLWGWHGLQAMEKAEEILTPLKESLESLTIDRVGIGEYFAVHFEKLGFSVTRFNNGGTARNDARFANRRAEIMWAMRERFKAGAISGFTDGETISQALSIRYGEDDRGRVEIESKEDARKRGVKSPDRFEALCMAFGDNDPAILTYYRNMAEQDAKESGEKKKLSPASFAPKTYAKPSIKPDTPSLQVYERTRKKLEGHLTTSCFDCKKVIEGRRINQGAFDFCWDCASKRGITF